MEYFLFGPLHFNLLNYHNIFREILRVLLVFSWYFLNCDIVFKITIGFEIIIINF
jgi:hypothetical protein